MTELKIREIKHGGFEINQELAGLVPMASDVEQSAMVDDINDNGQRDAIVLWKGEIVDGRCRQAALLTLGNRDIKYRELDDNLTEDEVAAYVKSVNTRRNLTSTQKAMSAAISKVNGRDSRSASKIAKSWGIGKTLFDNAKYITEQSSTMAKSLFDGKTVKIVNEKGVETVTSKITAVYAYLKRKEENVDKDDNDPYGWDANSYIRTQAGKDWFYETLRDIKDGKIKDRNKLIADLANLKFQLNTEGN